MFLGYDLRGMCSKRQENFRKSSKFGISVNIILDILFFLLDWRIKQLSLLLARPVSKVLAVTMY